MCAPRHAAAVVRPRERKKSADRRRRILISRLLIIRASVPRRKSPFPAYFKGFPAVSLLIPPYPAFLKYPVSPHLYTDLSFLTASKEIGLEATEVFRALDQGETVDSVKNLLVAPHCLQNRLLNRIDGEIKAAARGEGGYIGIKINSLTDKVLINKLIEASQAGVYIDMVVRGICCLRAGVPDETENIHIISIVGRYLEHSRIYIFGQGERARYYIGSADWMTRSTLRRVEIAAPVTAPALKARLQHIFDTMLADNCNARVQQPDGSYVRRMPGADAVDCQAQFYEEAYQANVHSSLK